MALGGGLCSFCDDAAGRRPGEARPDDRKHAEEAWKRVLNLNAPDGYEWGPSDVRAIEEMRLVLAEERRSEAAQTKTPSNEEMLARAAGVSEFSYGFEVAREACIKWVSDKLGTANAYTMAGDPATLDPTIPPRGTRIAPRTAEDQAELDRPTAAELLRQGGEWLGAARNWLKWHTRNGDQVTWGSGDLIEPQLSVRQIEDLASDVAAAAMRPQPSEERLSRALRARWTAEAEVERLRRESASIEGEGASLPTPAAPASAPERAGTIAVPNAWPDPAPEEALGSLDATEVATAIIFYRGHRFKERYSYASHIADELRRFYAAGESARSSSDPRPDMPFRIRFLAQEYVNDHRQCDSYKREREDLETVLANFRREVIEECVEAANTAQIGETSSMSHVHSWRAVKALLKTAPFTCETARKP